LNFGRAEKSVYTTGFVTERKTMNGKFFA